MLTYIYKIKTEKGFRYYEATDAVMAMSLAMDDGFKQYRVVGVCTDDVSVLNFAAFGEEE